MGNLFRTGGGEQKGAVVALINGEAGNDTWVWHYVYKINEKLCSKINDNKIEIKKSGEYIIDTAIAGMAGAYQFFLNDSAIFNWGWPTNFGIITRAFPKILSLNEGDQISIRFHGQSDYGAAARTVIMQNW